MRKVILGFLLLLLAGCAPTLLSLILQDPDKGELRFSTTNTGAIIVFSAGQKDAEGVALYIGGENLQITDDKCEPIDNGIGCELGTISTGQNYEITVLGSKLSANVTYYRPGSSQPSLLLAEMR